MDTVFFRVSQVQVEATVERLIHFYFYHVLPGIVVLLQGGGVGLTLLNQNCHGHLSFPRCR